MSVKSWTNTIDSFILPLAFDLDILIGILIYVPWFSLKNCNLSHLNLVQSIQRLPETKQNRVCSAVILRLFLFTKEKGLEYFLPMESSYHNRRINSLILSGDFKSAVLVFWFPNRRYSNNVSYNLYWIDCLNTVGFCKVLQIVLI